MTDAKSKSEKIKDELVRCINVKCKHLFSAACA